MNGDGHSSPIDVLVIVNELNDPKISDQSRRLPASMPYLPTPNYLDTNGDDFVAPLDGLLVINYLNANGTSEGEAGQVSIGDRSPIAQSDTRLRSSAASILPLSRLARPEETVLLVPSLTAPLRSAMQFRDATGARELIPAWRQPSTLSDARALIGKASARKPTSSAIANWMESIDDIAHDVASQFYRNDSTLTVRSKGAGLVVMHDSHLRVLTNLIGTER